MSSTIEIEAPTFNILTQLCRPTRMQVRREGCYPTKEETNSRKEEEKRSKKNCKSSKSKGTKEKRENGGTPFEFGLR
ncbi:hypothetical protein H5410_006388 [Solanum commersonii]|uniref:Uncharacterized protein n=1 Tax=Solanum commersonii TaxID=4109 RepID=A0A9J6AAA9_SOLCO|nr:hypothetical protein H5410_006388 [Solanum commersonii]